MKVFLILVILLTFSGLTSLTQAHCLLCRSLDCTRHSLIGNCRDPNHVGGQGGGGGGAGNPPGGGGCPLCRNFTNFIKSILNEGGSRDGGMRGIFPSQGDYKYGPAGVEMPKLRRINAGLPASVVDGLVKKSPCKPAVSGGGGGRCAWNGDSVCVCNVAGGGTGGGCFLPRNGNDCQSDCQPGFICTPSSACR